MFKKFIACIGIATIVTLFIGLFYAVTFISSLPSEQLPSEEAIVVEPAEHAVATNDEAIEILESQLDDSLNPPIINRLTEDELDQIRRGDSGVARTVITPATDEQQPAEETYVEPPEKLPVEKPVNELEITEKVGDVIKKLPDLSDIQEVVTDPFTINKEGKAQEAVEDENISKYGCANPNHVVLDDPCAHENAGNDCQSQLFPACTKPKNSKLVNMP